MRRLHLAGWTVTADIERTRATYNAISKGGCESCGCAYCRNFSAVVHASFPPTVLAFFDQAGIDPLKDAEVYSYGEVSPTMYSYEGEYYFWGHIEQDAIGELRSAPKFQVTFTSPSGLAQSEFRADGAICFLFDADLPCVLEEQP